jgi:predicted rRNA methylase YqxC with S4 and FtsJ domains
MRVDQCLVALGLAATRRAACRLIAEERVWLAAKLLTKPAQIVQNAALLRVTPNKTPDASVRPAPVEEQPEGIFVDHPAAPD